MTAAGIEYGTLCELLARAGSALSLSELHGGLCGALCAGGRPAAREWIGEQIDQYESDAVATELRALLERLERSSWDALTGGAFGFEPLLPDDGAGIEPRVDELASWCHGFLNGLALAGAESGQLDDMGEQLGEIVHDLSEISRAGAAAEELADPEAAEAALVELTEFVRVGVQIVFEELGPRQAAGEPMTVH